MEFLVFEGVKFEIFHFLTLDIKSINNNNSFQDPLFTVHSFGEQVAFDLLFVYMTNKSWNQYKSDVNQVSTNYVSSSD